MLEEYIQFVKGICNKACNTEECMKLCYEIYGLKEEFTQVRK